MDHIDTERHSVFRLGDRFYRYDLNMGTVGPSRTSRHGVDGGGSGVHGGSFPESFDQPRFLFFRVPSRLPSGLRSGSLGVEPFDSGSLS